MKKIMFLFLGLALISSCTKKRSKYHIKDAHGSYYSTDSYVIEENGCITFKPSCDCMGTVRICGSYSVETNKK